MVEILATLLVAAVALVTISGVASTALHVLNVPRGQTDDDPVESIILLLAQVLLNLCIVGAAASLSIGRYRLSARAWGLRPGRKVAPLLCVGVLVSAWLVLGVYRAVTVALGLEALEPESNVPESLFDHWAVLPFTLLLVLIVAPITEEMFFRGFVFNGMRRTAIAEVVILVAGAVLLGASTTLLVVGMLGPALIVLAATAALVVVVAAAAGRSSRFGRGPGGMYRHAAATLGGRVRVLRRPLGVYGAALISGMLFAAIHVTSADLLGLLIPFTIIGFLFALLVARTGSLWNSIIVHLAFNLISVAARFAAGAVWQ